MARLARVVAPGGASDGPADEGFDGVHVQADAREVVGDLFGPEIRGDVFAELVVTCVHSQSPAV